MNIENLYTSGESGKPVCWKCALQIMYDYIDEWWGTEYHNEWESKLIEHITSI